MALNRKIKQRKFGLNRYNLRCIETSKSRSFLTQVIIDILKANTPLTKMCQVYDLPAREGPSIKFFDYAPKPGSIIPCDDPQEEAKKYHQGPIC